MRDRRHTRAWIGKGNILEGQIALLAGAVLRLGRILNHGLRIQHFLRPACRCGRTGKHNKYHIQHHDREHDLHDILDDRHDLAERIVHAHIDILPDRHHQDDRHRQRYDDINERHQRVGRPLQLHIGFAVIRVDVVKLLAFKWNRTERADDAHTGQLFPHDQIDPVDLGLDLFRKRDRNLGNTEQHDRQYRNRNDQYLG